MCSVLRMVAKPRMHYIIIVNLVLFALFGMLILAFKIRACAQHSSYTRSTKDVCPLDGTVAVLELIGS